MCIAALLDILFAAGCGGGSASSNSTLPDMANNMQAKVAPVHLSFAIPKKIGAAHARSVQYISPSTTSLTITLTPSGGSALPPIHVACTATCTADFDAPVGANSISLLLTDGANGSGNHLSLSTTAETIVADSTNTFNLVTDGVVNSVAISPASPSVLGGVASDVAVTVSALDADGNTIVGPGNFVDASGNPRVDYFKQHERSSRRYRHDYAIAVDAQFAAFGAHYRAL